MRIGIKDPVGRSVAGAHVTVRSETEPPRQCAPEEEGYLCEVAGNAAVEFQVRALGFKPFRVRYERGELACCEYVFVLQIEDVRENVVTITRAESLIGNTPESISVIGRSELATTAAPTLDDALRQIPGFSIFRRSSSRNANPTTQGVSLRGVGASGASRSAVMFDGVPLNDPFGGWVQWNRIPPIAVEEVEVLRGAASSLYGGSGLSGAIDLRSRTVSEGRAFSGEVFGGSQRTASASVLSGGSWKGWMADASGGHFQTRGFIQVDDTERGPVDSYAGVRSVNLSTRIAHRFGDIATTFFRPTFFGESRANGTPAQINRTHSRQFVAGGKMQKPARSGGPAGASPSGMDDQGRNPQVSRSVLDFEWRAFGGTQIYDQTFSAVSADRSSESLTRRQRSPSQYFGASGMVNARVKLHTIVAGIEGREVRGSSDEIGFASGNPTSLLDSGGRERTLAFFAKDLIAIGERVIVSGGVRYDRWKNFRGLSVTTPLSTGLSTATTFPDRTEGAWSPSAAIQFQATNKLSLRAAGSSSFRSPTLNELYRGFRVGNVVTNANADLRAERADNFEAGAAYRFRNSSIRMTAFLTRIKRAVANITLLSTPSLITRQRQNAGETRTAGVEVDAATKLNLLDINFGYLFADSRVIAFPSNPSLIDKHIPQVPRHQFTFQARYPHGSWTFALQGRVASEQFDDDLNQFRLEPYLQLDAFISRRIGEKLSIFAAVENTFNSPYSTGRTPIRTLSSPIGARIGFRWN